jgi:hypothetical protein
LREIVICATTSTPSLNITNWHIMATLLRTAAHTQYLNVFARAPHIVFPPFLCPSQRRAIHIQREFYINGQWTAPAVARDHHVTAPPTAAINEAESVYCCR